MKLKNFLENFILVAIVLVIIQTFLYEFCVYSHWRISVRNILIFCGLFFDFLFTCEFIVRSVLSGRRKKIFHYWFYERGWVDFISSIPLLVLDSGPSVFLLLSGNMQAESAIGVLNILKVVKAIRVTRILRLVRIIKIFGKIHNVESKMAQHHTAAISTTAVFTIVTALIFFSIFTDSAGINEIKGRRAHYEKFFSTIKDIHKGRKGASVKVVQGLLSNDENILRLFNGKKLIVANVMDEKFTEYYNSEDYIIIKESSFTAFVSIVDIHGKIALNHIQSFFVIVLIVISFMFIYTRHFAQNISDLLHILNKGFRKKNYNLQVKIRDEYADQEIFRLARFYNDVYLPSKLKRIQEQDEKKSSGISMNDLKTFK